MLVYGKQPGSFLRFVEYIMHYADLYGFVDVDVGAVSGGIFEKQECFWRQRREFTIPAAVESGKWGG